MKHCTECGSTEIHEAQETLQMRYKKAQIEVISKYTICNQCGDEFESPEQSAQNDIAIRDSRKRYDGLLTSKEVKSIRVDMMLTQQEAGVVFGGGINAFSKYERGEVTQSESIDKLLRLCASDVFIFKAHLALIGKPELFKLPLKKCKVFEFRDSQKPITRPARLHGSTPANVIKVLDRDVRQYGT